jgi:hypothetical protein
VRFVLAHKINFGTEKMSYTNTNHKFVFVYHKHKKSFGIAPIWRVKSDKMLVCMCLL